MNWISLYLTFFLSVHPKSEQVRVRIHGSRRKANLVESDIIASNGIIHIIDKMLDTVPPTVISDNKVC